MTLPNLFWKRADGTSGLLATPFRTEEEFEKTVFETQEILEDIFLLKRQIRGGNKSGIPDIVGIDNDGKVCIIEMKNVQVDSSIIPQVLQYAFWAESNPDSIKSLWLECDNKPENLSNFSGDAFDVRVIIIAPKILRSTLDIVEKISYQVDFVEVNRWVEGTNLFFLVARLEPEKKTKPRPIAGMQAYDEAFYKREYNKQSASSFLKYVAELEEIIHAEEWALETKFNKSYCGFKAGFFNAFGIQWMGTKTFAFFFKLSEEEATKIDIPMTKYEGLWKQATYYIEPGKTRTKDYLPLFEMAYKKLAGRN